MDLLKNTAIAIPLGLIYYIVSSMAGEVLYKDIKVEERQSNVSIIMFIAALIALFLAQFIFGSDNKLHNRGIQFGLLLGGSGLLFHTLVRNWDITSNEYKLGVFSLVFIILIFCAYKYKNN